MIVTEKRQGKVDVYRSYDGKREERQLGGRDGGKSEWSTEDQGRGQPQRGHRAREN